MIDDNACARLIEDNLGRIRRIARVYARPGERDDLVQDILLQLWRARSGFRAASRPSTWLYRIALNTAISHRRKRVEPVAEMPPDPVGDIGDPVDTAELLSSFIGGLGEADRTTMVLFIEGLDPAAIAEVLGTSKGAVATRLTRLKRRFEHEFIEEAT